MARHGGSASDMCRLSFLDRTIEAQLLFNIESINYDFANEFRKEIRSM